MSDMPIMKTWTAPSPEGEEITYEIYDEQARQSAASLEEEMKGKEPNGTAESKVSDHNTNATAHHDIRILLSELQAAVTAFLDTDEETMNQLSELITGIGNNKTSIEALTTGKVNVTDIIDNLETNLANKPLSAAQGVVLNKLISDLRTAVNNINVPTKMSQLTDDVGFAKQEEVDGLSEEIANKTTVHTLTGADLHQQQFDTEGNGLLVGDIVVVTEWFDSNKGITYNEGDMWKVTAVNTIQLVVNLKGYTPQKGVDYFTEADKTEMVDLVIAALPTWTGGSY